MGAGERWFATTQYKVSRLSERRGLEPVVHAKQVGTRFSACGRDTSNWDKRWEPFRTVPGRSCPVCVRAVTGVNR
ncbi:hypothetical protein JCM18899A_09280 [Nocardioides sp. AN3]